MSSPLGLGRTALASSRPSPCLYICPRCRLGQKSGSQRPSAVRRTRDNIKTQVRNFSISRRLAAVEAVDVGLSTSLSPSYDLPLSQSRRGTQSIRDQLRSWAAENQSKKDAQLHEDIARGNVPARGRAIEVPQSAYLEEAVDEDEEGEYANDVVEEPDMADYSGDYLPNKITRVAPGDLVYRRRSATRRSLVLFVHRIQSIGLWLHTNGTWSAGPWNVKNPMDIMPTPLRQWATEEEMAPLISQLPTKLIRDEIYNTTSRTKVDYEGHLPTTVTAHMINRFTKLREQMAAFRRQHLTTFDNFYHKIAHDTEYLHLPFDKLTRTAFGFDLKSLDDAGRLATFKLLTTNSTRLQLYQSTMTSDMSVIIVPKHVAESCSRVIEWTREYQQAAADASKGRNVKALINSNPLSSFVNKARRIIVNSRSIRSPTTIGSLGPSKKAPHSLKSPQSQEVGETFTENDRAIIIFMADTFARTPATPERNKHDSVGALILRAIGAYPKMDLNLRIGTLFMQELGLMSPWMEQSGKDVILPHFGSRGQLGRQYQEYHAQQRELSKYWPRTRNEGRIPLQDTLTHLRKDLGDMLVLCIDPKSTILVDDGISLEESTEIAGAHWVHAHIAHPSAFLSKDHPASLSARAIGTNIYGPGGTETMMDPKITNHFSLAPGTEAFTVSTLLATDGEVLDIKVSATKIHNVVRLRSDIVNRLTGLEPNYQSHLIVGSNTAAYHNDPVEHGSVGDEARDEELVRQHLPIIEKLHNILLRRLFHRRTEVPVWANFASPVPYEQAKHDAAFGSDKVHLLNGRHYLSDPTIYLASGERQIRRLGEFFETRDVTTHAMWLASESFGKWMSDRQLPAVFTGSASVEGSDIKDLNDVGLEERSPYVHPVANVQAHAVEHAILNMQQYCRITSPLRRFPDLIGQWNADAYLRAEAEGTVTSGQPSADLLLPFSVDDVREYLRTDFWVMSAGERHQKMSYFHWTLQALFRAFHFKEAPLPEIWDVEVADPFKKNRQQFFIKGLSSVAGTLKPFGVLVFLMQTPLGWEQDAQPGQYLPCKIELVDTIQRHIVAKPVGPPTDDRQHHVSYICSQPDGEKDATKSVDNTEKRVEI